MRRPPAPDYEGYDVRHFEVGGDYDVTLHLANPLVIIGYAMIRAADEGGSSAGGPGGERNRR